MTPARCGAQQRSDSDGDSDSGGHELVHGGDGESTSAGSWGRDGRQAARSEVRRTPVWPYPARPAAAPSNLRTDTVCALQTADTTAPVPGGHARSTGRTGGRSRLQTVRQHVEET